MTEPTILRMKPYIQPFERLLAVQELESLIGTDSAMLRPEHDYAIRGEAALEAARSLAYWEAIGEEYTPQVRREAASVIARNGVALSELPFLQPSQIDAKAPRSRCLRYGPHGIHEYRGKFFPQLVKALINISGVRDGTVLDPMCGSGTTLVEAAAAGHRAVGFDMNPLSVFVSRTKCCSLHLTPSRVVGAYEVLVRRVESGVEPSPPAPRGSEDDLYLRQWFSQRVLAELDLLVATIDGLPDREVAQLFKVSLSNIVRRVSFQKEEDLRIRREYKKVDPDRVRALFLEEALRSAKAVVADLAHGLGARIGEARVAEGDARSFVRDGGVEAESIDLVVTSPPYATALPYLDTDRLSLSFLGLLSRPDHRGRDREMIGNREITDLARRRQWERYTAERAVLPASVTALIDRIERENGEGKVGFRRRNLGALLATYFFDMRSVLLEIQKTLRPGGQAFLVVGNNRTKTPAGEIEIRTSELLLAMAEAAGFADCRRVPMEMLHSRDIFRENRTPSEHILSMRRQ